MDPSEFKPPFKPSWIDRLVDWLHGLPFPTWATMAVLFFLFGLQNHLANWLAGIQPWGEFEAIYFLYQLFTVEVLYFMKYLDRDAVRALRNFRPLIDASDEEIAYLRYRLTTQPARPVWILTALGLLLGAYFSYSVAVFGSEEAAFSLFDLYGTLGFGLPLIFALVFIYRIVIQLRSVGRLYASSSGIDLFDLEPVYALSSHTAKTGFILLFMIYSSLLVEPRSLLIPANLITTALASLIALVAFILPLRGINRRLVAEKKDALRRIRSRLKDAFARLESKYDSSALSEMKELGSAIANLERQMAFVQKIPTWPWQPGTMRGFLSAMLLPIVIWVIQQLLARALPA